MCSSDLVQGATGQRVGSVIQSIATIGIATGLGMYYLPKLGGVSLAFAPIVIFAAYFQGAMMTGSNILEKDAIENASKIAVQAVSNIRTVAALTKERDFVAKYLELLTSTHRKVLRMSHMRGFMFGLSQGVPFVAYGVVMFYGGVCKYPSFPSYLKPAPILEVITSCFGPRSDSGRRCQLWLSFQGGTGNDYRYDDGWTGDGVHSKLQ